MAATDLIARNVRRFRDERQLSQGELARRTNIAKQTISHLERGLGNPTIDTLAQLADALGVSLRALVTELGTEVRTQRADTADWLRVGTADLRELDRVFGSGYVTTSVMRLTTARGASHHSPLGRGSLRHVYVVSGTVRLGPQTGLVEAARGDFVRFPAELPHLFEALTDTAVLHVVTTAPQLSRATDERAF